MQFSVLHSLSSVKHLILLEDLLTESKNQDLYPLILLGGNFKMYTYLHISSKSIFSLCYSMVM
jgi:hypothetical protein